MEALKNLCLVNRLLCDVAQPVLYHHLSPFYWDWRHRISPLLLPFLQTISRVPSLAASTRELDIRYIIPAETNDYRLPALLRTLTSTLLDNDSCELDENPEAYLANVLVKVLLCSTPNLETACLGILPGWKFPLLQTVSNTHSNQRHALLSLTTLSLTGPSIMSNAPAYAGLDNLLASIPNLQNLRLQELTYYPPSHLLRKVRRLELCHVPISGTHLKEMLHECTALEEFHYKGISFDAGVTRMGPIGSELVDALSPAASDTLRCLEISYANHTPCIKNTHPEIASLKHFGKLERLNLATGLGALGNNTASIESSYGNHHTRSEGDFGVSPRGLGRQQYLTFGKVACFEDILPDSVKVFCPPCWPESILALASSVVARKGFPSLERVEMEHDGQHLGPNWMTKARNRDNLKTAFADGRVAVSFAEDRKSLGFSQWHVQ